MGRAVIEKIIARHTRDEVKPKNIVWMDLDVRSARDFGGANVVAHLERHFPERPVADTSRTFFTFDCVVPARDAGYANNQHRCRRFAREHGIRVFDVGEGIGSHVMIEQGLALPGATIVGTDSHLNIMGAVGAFGQGMGDADIAFAFKTGRTWFEVPQTIRVELVGQPAPSATAKDLTLFLVGKLGASGALGRAVELCGPAIDELQLADRVTLASMATETGAIAFLMRPNERVLQWCRDRSPRSDLEPVDPDEDADYAQTLTFDLTGLQPLAARPGRPDDVVPVGELSDVRVDSVFVGSCTNGRVEDIVQFASVLKGRKVSSQVQAKVVPATRETWGELLRLGLLQDLFAAGVIVSNPGCGGCASGQIGMTGRQEVQVSTSNRNFRGKQGAGDTYLVSPATAAWTALRGHIARE